MERKSKQRGKTSNHLFKYLLITAGTFFVGLGILGIFLPILPTTPFLLLATACYARSSKRFYDWLINNRWFGTYIKNYQEGKGVSLKIKIISIFFLWLTILFSIFYVVNIFIVQIILIIILIAVTIHIVLLKTLSELKEN